MTRRQRKRSYILGIIGCGNMGRALLEGVLAEKVLPPGRVLVSDIDSRLVSLLRRRLRVKARDTARLVAESDVVVLAVKSQQMAGVLPVVRRAMSRRKLLVSVAAGVTIRRLAGETGAKRIVRVMPNLPMKVRAGLIAYAPGPGAARSGRVIEELFSPSGFVFRVPESRMDAVTAVSGSGPGYLFYLAELIETICRTKGFPAAVGRRIAARLLIGAGRMLEETGEDAGTLRRRVSSPGGTTLAGLAVLERRRLGAVLAEAVAAAERRSRELSKA